jgi:hypothetical protein
MYTRYLAAVIHGKSGTHVVELSAATVRTYSCDSATAARHRNDQAIWASLLFQQFQS